MTNFRSKYIYPVAITRLILLLVLTGAVVFFIFTGLPVILKESVRLLIGSAIGVSMLYIYLLLVLGRPALTERYILIIENGSVMLKDILSGKSIPLDENCKGFSSSNYSNYKALAKFKTLFFYFKDGRKIELPQFLYSNFELIKPALIANSCKYLGEEPLIPEEDSQTQAYWATGHPLGLIPGSKYKVIKAFTDYDRDVHEVGETWTFARTNFLPYDDGLTLHVFLPNDLSKETIYRLQWRDEVQGEIIENFLEYVEPCK